MNSTLKVAVPLVLFVAVIFGLTIIATQTPSTPPPTGGEGGGDEDAPTGPALNFASTKMAYRPDSDDLSARFFPGMFEVSDVPVPISFWFQNPHKVPVKVSALNRSCTACSSARVAVFPDGAMKDFQLKAAASLPLGAAGPPGLLVPLALTHLLHQAEWKSLDFEHPDLAQEVAARTADGSPTWGILQIGIQVRSLGAQPKSVLVGLTPGKGMQQRLEFDVMLAGVTPFNIYPYEAKLGDLGAGSPPRKFVVFYWSGTRQPADLPPPVLSGFDPNDPFFEVGQPVPLTRDECAALGDQLLAIGKTLRVTAAYQFPVTVYRRREGRPGGPAEPDIGPFDRTLAVTGPGTGHTATLPISGNMVGLVGLVGPTDKQREKIDLGTFTGSAGTEKTVTLASEGSGPVDFTLEVARDKTTQPLTATVAPAPSQGSRRFWTLTVTVPPGFRGDLPADSLLVLRAKAKGGDRLIRIPVTGRGSQR